MTGPRIGPAARYATDAAALRQLANWLEERVSGTAEPPFPALDYFRLAERLQAMAQGAARFAVVYAGELP